MRSVATAIAASGTSGGESDGPTWSNVWTTSNPAASARRAVSTAARRVGPRELQPEPERPARSHRGDGGWRSAQGAAASSCEREPEQHVLAPERRHQLHADRQPVARSCRAAATSRACPVRLNGSVNVMSVPESSSWANGSGAAALIRPSRIAGSGTVGSISTSKSANQAASPRLARLHRLEPAEVPARR